MKNLMWTLVAGSLSPPKRINANQLMNLRKLQSLSGSPRFYMIAA
ncbi:MAG: hypothetical protein PHU25_02610 [Deltaproteobacteria bacterium]|nr:hypothetical protein [Deltaproteobacteria bacterium]